MPKSNPADKAKVQTRQYRSDNNKSVDTFRDAYQANKVVEIGSKGQYTVKKDK
jgi:hypothetical protein